MKKIKQFTFVLFIFSALAFSDPVTQVFAQGGGHVSGAHLSGGQCDSNPACNPASGTCCGQCDPGPACNPNDPNAIPCCSLEGNSGSQPQGRHERPRHPGTPNDPPGSILLVKKLEKMSHELKECQSLTKELKSAAQPQARQAPRRCQSDEANQAVDQICGLAYDLSLLVRTRVMEGYECTTQNCTNVTRTVSTGDVLRAGGDLMRICHTHRPDVYDYPHPTLCTITGNTGCTLSSRDKKSAEGREWLRRQTP